MVADVRSDCRVSRPVDAKCMRSGFDLSEAEIVLSSVHHVVPLATIVRERQLPVKGTVRVRLGQRVSPGDIVADATWAREHVFLDVARTLGISGAAAERVIRCKPGESVAMGALIAKGGGLVPKTIRTPRAGRVVATGGGQVLIEAGESRIELRAGLSGTVQSLIPDRGVVIQTTGALVQGVWGNGRVDTGVMINLADKPDSVLTPARLDVSMRGSILVGGQVQEAGLLRTADEISVRGLLIGGIFPSLLPVAREMRYPIVVTDGFGAVSMNTAAHRLISTNVKREVTLNAEVYDRYTGSRPEAIIPLPAPGVAAPNEIAALAAGQPIRICCQPAPGMMGTILGLPDGLATFPSGLRAPGAEVRLENGEQLLIPLVNLEVVG